MMANSYGYYQMHRGWMRNTVFGREPFTRAQAWIWMIEQAGWRDEPRTIDGETVMLRRGQFSHSTRYLAQAWRWSRGKVERFIKRLEAEEMIGAESGVGRLVITISNYEKYQATSSSTEPPNAAENKVSPGEPEPPPSHQPSHQAEKTEPPNAAENKVSPGEPEPPSAENRATNRAKKRKNSKNPLLRKGDDSQEDSILPSQPPDPAALIFSREPGGCLYYLIQRGNTEQKARGVLGRWRSQFGDGAVIDAVSIAIRNSASEPVGYVSKILKNREGGAQHDGYQGPYSPEFPIN